MTCTTLAIEDRSPGRAATALLAGRNLEVEDLAGATSLQSFSHRADAAQQLAHMAEALAVVAHELRNPLVPIRTVAALLTRVPPEELPRLQATIERQVARMASLIADLLEVARTDEGKLRLDRCIVDMRTVVAEAVDNGAPSLHARSQCLVLEMPAEALAVRGDAARLDQVVSNLLDNASKYTPCGGTVRVSLDGAGDELRLTVSDNGIGISAQALPHVFDRFVQDAHAVDHDGAGLGIGLSVVRELVHAHGGSVQAQSAGPGQGSRFVVTLPRMASRADALTDVDPVPRPRCHG